ncbi:hypothetical protein CRUP_012425 [Coryphaenoides rupestris]|nr:hypothetical protein CRUP_012425 [Coryphaenoides rupestris]
MPHMKKKKKKKKEKKKRKKKKRKKKKKERKRKRRRRRRRRRRRKEEEEEEKKKKKKKKEEERKSEKEEEHSNNNVMVLVIEVVVIKVIKVVLSRAMRREKKKKKKKKKRKKKRFGDLSIIITHYFLIVFGHDGQKPLELRTDEECECDEWVEAIQQASYSDIIIEREVLMQKYIHLVQIVETEKIIALNKTKERMRPYHTNQEDEDPDIKKIKKVQSFMRGWLCRRKWKIIVQDYICSPHAESMRKRNQIVFNMVEAETEYVHQLYILVNFFLRPLRMAASSKKPPINHDDVSSIFLNRSDLFDILLPMLNIYQEFVRNHQYSLQIPRYIITLHELLAHTPHEHVERKSLEFAKSKLEELSRVMHDEVSDTENIRKNLAIERMIVEGCDILLDTSQTFVRQGSLIQLPSVERGKLSKVRLGSLSLKKEGERQCFLFTKHFLICTRSSGGKLHLLKSGGGSGGGGAVFGQLDFKLVVEPYDAQAFTVVLLAPSRQEKAAWTSDISQENSKVTVPHMIKSDVRLHKDDVDICFSKTLNSCKVPQIRYASVERLLERLTDLRFLSIDFLNTFLHTYRIFTSAAVVMDKLADIYKKPFTSIPIRSLELFFATNQNNRSGEHASDKSPHLARKFSSPPPMSVASRTSSPVPMRKLSLHSPVSARVGGLDLGSPLNHPHHHQHHHHQQHQTSQSAASSPTSAGTPLSPQTPHTPGTSPPPSTSPPQDHQASPGPSSPDQSPASTTTEGEELPKIDPFSGKLRRSIRRAVLESASLDKITPESRSPNPPAPDPPQSAADAGEMSPCRSPSTPRHLRYRQPGEYFPFAFLSLELFFATNQNNRSGEHASDKSPHLARKFSSPPPMSVASRTSSPVPMRKLSLHSPVSARLGGLDLGSPLNHPHHHQHHHHQQHQTSQSAASSPTSAGTPLSPQTPHTPGTSPPPSTSPPQDHQASPGPSSPDQSPASTTAEGEELPKIDPFSGKLRRSIRRAVLESASLDKITPESRSPNPPAPDPPQSAADAGEMSPCRSPSTPRHLRYRQPGAQSAENSRSSVSPASAFAIATAAAGHGSPPVFTNAERTCDKDFIIRRAATNRVLNVLRHWVSKHSQDFEMNGELKIGVVCLLEEDEPEDIQLRIEDILQMAECPRAECFESLPAMELAEQITLLDHIVFRSIPYESMSNLVASQIMTHTDVGSRASSIEKWVAVADICRCLNNYNGVLEITSALNRSAIYRLKKTWAKISKQTKALMDKLQKTVSSEGRFKNLRETLKNCNPPCVPYLGMYLTDLAFIEEGTPNFTEEGLVNFSKMRMISHIIREIRQFQQTPYRIEHQVKVTQYLLDKTLIMDEDTLYDLSLKIEPRLPA